MMTLFPFTTTRCQHDFHIARNMLITKLPIIEPYITTPISSAFIILPKFGAFGCFVYQWVLWFYNISMRTNSLTYGYLIWVSVYHNRPEFKIILHRIISVVCFTNFPSEIRSLHQPTMMRLNFTSRAWDGVPVVLFRGWLTHRWSRVLSF